MGWTSFRFDWLVQSDKAIYTLIIASVWQGAGFAMALFLAGLRSVDTDLIKAAQIDGAGPWRTYRRVLLPTIWPIFITVFVILLQSAIKTFDLVRALTGGGPGISTMLPTLVVYDFMFQRSELGRGSAAAVLLLLVAGRGAGALRAVHALAAAKAGARMTWCRVIVYAALLVLALLFLVPLGVVVRELAALQPGDRLDFDDRLAAASDLCQLRPRPGAGSAWPSIAGASSPICAIPSLLAIPATILSTLLGALAGYSISLWRFRGDQIVFGLVTLGVFLPEQMKLIPWVVVLRDLSLINTIAGLVLIHTVQGMSFTTLFCRNYYASIPPGPDESRAYRRRRFLPDFLADRAAAVAADPDRDRDLPVHRNLERVPVMASPLLPATSSRSPPH